MQTYIAQGIGVLGLLFAIISFQQNTNKRILLFQILATITFSVHFLLLGAYTGSLMNFFGIMRGLLFYNREKKWADKKYWLYVFSAIYIISGIATYENFYSIFPTVSMVLSTFGLWVKNPKHIRLIMLPSSPLWLIYNIVNFSIAGIITEIFVISSLAVAMFRFDYYKPKDKKQV